MLLFEQQSEDALRAMLNGLGTRDAVLNYQQIHGLLYAMANSPEPIAASEWFELIWLSDDPQFDDPAEAKMFYRLLLSLFDAIEKDVLAARYRPGAVGLSACTADGLYDWCDGFLMGHQYLEDIWTVALSDLDDPQLYEQIDAALDWALAFVEGIILDGDAEDADDRFLAEQLHFQQLLESYRTVRSNLSDAGLHLSVEKIFQEMESIAPDERCLCGSGRRFAQCCLH